jgi:predicted nuclease of predicted toxin-antitoxin system
MRILANENLPRPVVAALRDAGHDVAWVRESMPGATDFDVLALAQAEHRIVLTADLDFGELAFRSGLPAQCGVVLVRLDWKNPEADNLAIVAAIASKDDWSGVFAVVERDRVRIRPLRPPLGQ